MFSTFSKLATRNKYFWKNRIRKRCMCVRAMIFWIEEVALFLHRGWYLQLEESLWLAPLHLGIVLIRRSNGWHSLVPMYTIVGRLCGLSLHYFHLDYTLLETWVIMRWNTNNNVLFATILSSKWKHLEHSKTLITTRRHLKSNALIDIYLLTN
jgi:hypothetical protein